MAVRSIKRNKYKFKWTKELTFLIIGLVALIIVTIVLSLPTKVERLISKWPGANLTTETVFQEVDENRLANLINNGDYVFVFYASPSDSNAATKLSLVQTYANNFDISSVYWLDSSDVYSASDETKNTRDYKDQIANREAALKNVDLDETLSFWVYSDGKLVLDYANYADSSDTNSFEQVVSKAFGSYKASI